MYTVKRCIFLGLTPPNNDNNDFKQFGTISMPVNSFSKHIKRKVNELLGLRIDKPLARNVTEQQNNTVIVPNTSKSSYLLHVYLSVYERRWIQALTNNGRNILNQL